MAIQPASTTPPGERITCSIQGPRNDYGHPKLLATIDEAGIWVWCKYCRDKHFLSKERVMGAWSRGESVQCQPGIDAQERARNR